MPDYPNRTDLRNPATRKVAFTGQTYGQAAQQAAAQAAVAPGSAPTQVQAQQAAQQQPTPVPGEKPLFRPTERPTEPLTAGADFGAGPTGQQAGIIPRIIPFDQVVEELRTLYRMFPNEDLADMISKYGNRGY